MTFRYRTPLPDGSTLNTGDAELNAIGLRLVPIVDRPVETDFGLVVLQLDLTSRADLAALLAPPGVPAELRHIRPAASLSVWRDGSGVVSDVILDVDDSERLRAFAAIFNLTRHRALLEAIVDHGGRISLERGLPPRDRSVAIPCIEFRLSPEGVRLIEWALKEAELVPTT